MSGSEAQKSCRRPNPILETGSWASNSRRGRESPRERSPPGGKRGGDRGRRSRRSGEYVHRAVAGPIRFIGRGTRRTAISGRAPARSLALCSRTHRFWCSTRPHPLDVETEEAVQQALETLRKRRTTFVIAHRLATVVSADQIVVLKGGSILESGTHASLMDAGGYYSSLVHRQKPWLISNDVDA